MGLGIYRVQCLGSWDQDLLLRILGSGFIGLGLGVQVLFGLRVWILNLRCRIGFRVCGLGFRRRGFQGLGFRVPSGTPIRLLGLDPD